MKFINFCSDECPLNENDAIVIEKSEEFMQAVHTVSDYLRSMPLNPTQNNMMIELMTELYQTAQRSSFLQGFEAGLKISTEK